MADRRATLFLAPGASGDTRPIERFRNALRPHRVDVATVHLTAKDADRAVPQYREALAKAGAGAAAIVGGQSFGGRVASLLAAQADVGGLVLLCYPLHAPGRPQAWQTRTAHWPRIRCPVLLLSGDADPFARSELLEVAVEQLPNAELVTYPGVRHSLAPVLDDAARRIGRFVDSVS